MQVGGPIPFHVARAYGLKAPTRAPEIRPAANVAPAKPARTVDTYGNADRTGGLVAGKVTRPVEFDTPLPRDAATLPLYTRAADKIEAAVAIRMGRTIDVTG